MFRAPRFTSLTLGVLTFLFTVNSASAQVASAPPARVLITQNIDEGNLVELRNNTRSEANVANDRGAVAEGFQMEHMLLQLRRSPEQEQALQQFTNELETKGSPNFHRWISAQEFGARFGLAQQDLDTINRWLGSHGFRVNVVYPNGMVIDFSGTAGQVREAFKTEIHNLEVNGEKHVANMSNPRVPAALAPAVVGIVSLHDFRPQTMHKMHAARPNFTFNDPFGGTTFAVVPADLATIYNLNPLFSAGYSGQGQTIVVIEDTDVFSTSDWNTFRSTLGLSSYSSGSFSTVYPAPSSGTNNCSSPGVIAPNDAEAILDAEWASAAAPNAAILMATCADTTTTFGGLIAFQNLINASSQPPAIMSISYGQCETQNGESANAAYNAAYQQAVSEGVSVFVAAGDSGAAGCDNSVSEATHGIGVNAFASTPYNVAVGGTDFSDTYSSTNGNYWSSTNTSSYGSALSYIPEIPWNDSCAGQLLSTYEGYPTPYGSNGFCSSPLGGFLQTTVAGGGGPSGCASGAPSVSGEVGGSCQGWPKPSWQSVLGNPNDGVRDTPDISLFAADGLWSHYYVFCWSDTRNGGASCSGAPSGWSGAGGTSFASPIMAGIQALVNQKVGGSQGNPTPAYYQLAATEYGSNGTSSCNSSSGTVVASNCIFYDVTQGDTDVNCTGNANCFLPSGTSGVLSTSDSSYRTAYGSTTGWDFATGIGSINAANLVNNWPSSVPNYSLSASPSSLTLTQGGSGGSTITVNAQNGFSANVTLSASGLPSGVTASFSPNPASTASTITLTASSTAAIGTIPVTITGTSDSLTNTTTITLTVNPVGNFALSASPSSLSIMRGASGAGTIIVTPQGGFSSSVALSASGLPSGVTASFSPNPASTASTMTLTVNSAATIGTVSVTITGTSGSLTNTTTISLTVIAAPNYSLSASPNSLTLTQGGSGGSTITVNAQNGFSGNVTLSTSGLPSGVSASFSPNPATATSTLTFTASGTASTGTVTVTITGISGNLTNTTTITLTVTFVSTLPSIWSDGDVGSVGIAGSSSYANGTFTVKGAGASVTGAADGLHYVYQSLSGDGTIVARVVTLSANAAAGLMIRETLSANSRTAFLQFYNPNIYFSYRTSTGGSVGYAESGTVSLPHWVSLVRSGSTVTASISSDGVNWVQLSSQTISMATNVYIGLGVTSGSTSHLATGTLDNVSVSSAAAPAPVISNLSATTGPIGSQVVISGSGFGTSQGSSAVMLNGTQMAINSWSATSISVTVASGATSGPMAVFVAPSMNASNPVNFTVAAAPPPTYTLSASPTSFTLTQGASSTSTITVNALNGFADSVALSASGLPSGVTASFSPNPASTASTMTLTVNSAATIGTVSVTITGTSGSLTNTTTISLTVIAAPNYSLSASPNSLTLTQGGSGGSTITVNAQNGFSGNVTLSTSGLPSGVSASFSPNPATATSTLTFTASGTASTGTVTVTITGISGNLTNTTTITLTVTFVSTLPSIWSDGDVGSVGIAGSSSYANGTFTVKGAGASVTGAADGLHYVYQSLSGDGTIVARVVTLSANAAAGLMIRETLSANSRTAFLQFYNPNIYFSYRTSTGGSVGYAESGTVSLPHWVSLVRSGSTVTASISSDGVNWVQLSSQTISMATNVYIGLGVTSGSTSHLATGTLDNVSVSSAAAPAPVISNLSATTGPIGSQVVISGSGFGTSQGSSAVMLNGTQMAINSWSATSISVTVASGATSGPMAVFVAPSMNASNPVNFTVAAAPPPTYTLSASPTSFTLTQGASSTSTITVNALNGFADSVALSASGLPSGVTASFSPNPASTASTMTLTVNSAATIGTVSVTITGTSGSLTNTTTISLTVIAAPNYSLSASPNSLTLTQGGSGGSTITVNAQNGFSGNVTLSTSGLPSGVSASFSPNPATATSTLTFTASGTASTGTVTVTITGISGNLTNTTTITLTVTFVSTLPSIWSDGDVGSVGIAGSSSYANGTFTVKGAGASVTGAADGLHYVYQSLSGDGTIVARVVTLSANAAAGLMIRETLSANSRTAFLQFYNPNIYFSYRTSTGGSVGYAESGTVSLPHWVSLVRSGSTVTASISSDGVNWVQLSSQTISMATNVYIGLGVTSGSTSHLATGTLDNVSVSSAAAPAPVISNLSATTGPIGSQVVISGSGFGTSQGSSAVMLNGTQMAINSWSATSISVTVASGATSGPMAVFVAPSMNASNPVNFTVTSN